MNIKRTIITAIVGLTLVALVAPGVAQGVTIEELLAQIAQLQAQLLALQGGTASGSVPAACVGVTFTRNLTVGSTGSDVKCLQAVMNLSATTRVATTGVGSPGMETTYFGPLTLSAVKVYQAEKGWTPANQVGPLTRGALNASLGGVVTPVTPGCPAGAIYNSITGALCAVVMTPGTTGFIDASTLAPSPASNANITATSNVPVLGVNVKAINSNMTVNSAKVQLAVLNSTPAAEHPTTLVRQLYIYDGSTLLGTFPVNTNTVYKTSTNAAGTPGTYYYVILSGFNFMVPANTTKVLTVTADFAPVLETSRQLTINLFDGTSVGAVDGTGATRTGGVTTTKVYTVAYTTVGSSTLTGTANTSTPIDSSVMVDTTNGTTNIPMLVFNAKSTVGASVLTDLTFDVVATDAAMFNKVTAVNLYDGSILLGSVTPVVTSGGTGTAAFSDLTINIAKDATKVLTVKFDVADLDNGGGLGTSASNGDTVRVDITPSTDFIYTEPDLSTGTPVGATITGKTMHFYDGKAAAIALSAPLSALYSYNATTPTASNASGVITFNIRGDGGVLTKLDTTTVVVKACNSTACYASGSTLGTIATDVTVSPNTATSPDGTTATVTVNASITRGINSGYVWFQVYSIAWDVGGTTATQIWGLDDYRTPSVNMY